MDRERRTYAGTVETREEGERRSLQGYAAVFDVPTVIMGLFEERVAPGAFTDAIGRDDVRALFNHDPNLVLGRSSAGTLRLTQDDQGLRYDITPPDTTTGRDVSALVSRGDVQGSSFSFDVEAQSWDYPKGALPVRTITRAKLYDVGPVTFPAYEQTTVSARCQQAATARPAAEDLSREISRWRLAAL